MLDVHFCKSDGLSALWSTVWKLIVHPGELLQWPAHSVVGLGAFLIGFVVLLAGQCTLGLNHCSTVAIRAEHQLVTRGIYRFTRNPMYLGVLLILLGLPISVGSWNGFLTGMLLIPLFLNRIRLEERLLEETFLEAFRAYKQQTKTLIPLVY